MLDILPAVKRPSTLKAQMRAASTGPTRALICHSSASLDDSMGLDGCVIISTNIGATLVSL
jgi:hypothetical protein